MSKFLDILTPPGYRGFGMPERALDVAPLPVQVERSDEAQGPNSTTVEGNFARTWRAKPVTITCPVAVINGNFTDAIKYFDVQEIVDTFMFNPPPDGLTYLFSFQSTLSFALDAVTNIYRPYAEFAFCNPGGTWQGACYPIPLNRGRHRFACCIWTDAAVPVLYSVQVAPIFLNLGVAR